MTEIELREFLEANSADIKAAVRQRMIDKLLAEQQWEISSAITKVVNEWVAAEVIPEVKAFLADQKGPIIKAACAGAAAIGDTLATALVEQTAKNLSKDSWKFKSVVKALFD